MGDSSLHGRLLKRSVRSSATRCRRPSSLGVSGVELALEWHLEPTRGSGGG